MLCDNFSRGCGLLHCVVFLGGKNIDDKDQDQSKNNEQAVSSPATWRRLGAWLAFHGRVNNFIFLSILILQVIHYCILNREFAADLSYFKRLAG